MINKYNKNYILIGIQIIISFFLIKNFFDLGLSINDKTFYFYLVTLFLKLIFCNLIIFFFFDKKNLKKYSFIIFFTLLFGIYLSESFLVLKYNLNKQTSLFEYYKQEIKKDKNQVVVVPPMQHFNELNIFPLSGISKKKTINCNEHGYFSSYISDRFGFNNPDNVWDSNDPTTLIVGDSFAHGACVNRPYDLVSLLREKTKENYINIGYGDNGPLIELASLREFWQEGIKDVYWFYYEGNDLEGIIKEKQNHILMKYLQNSYFSQNIRSKQSEIDLMAKNLIKIKFDEKKILKKNRNLIYKIIQFLKINKTRNLFIIKKNNIIHPKNTLELENIILAANEFTQNKNSKFYFIYLPEYSRYEELNYDTSNYIKIKKILSSNKINFIDVVEIFDKEKKEPSFYFANQKISHYNHEGYNLIASKIILFIKDFNN